MAMMHGALGQPVPLPNAPDCTPPARATPRQTEGPFYTPNAPRRHSLVSGAQAGERIVLTGFVVTRGCRPLPGAVVDVWQADASGAYDNAGYNLRGHEVTDAQGRYWFETIRPAAYSGRTAHIHVKVQAPGQPVLTTQVYFPNEQRNDRDSIFNRALVLKINRVEGARQGPLLVGRYDFVLDTP
jgi:protocatechuate 3,4-dioxygenase beta subunit